MTGSSIGLPTPGFLINKPMFTVRCVQGEGAGANFEIPSPTYRAVNVAHHSTPNHRPLTDP